ncbi:MAG: tripartite tricarboxylate transporter substrate binding protein [Betaproteobacteria bacterium]|nr:tripartite tricarboxylate transporter substrate binding protein [Betaproteobacteria bacterium]
MVKRLAVAFVLAAAAGLAGGAYPERPIRLLVPSSPGSGPDTVARILATRLSATFGQQVVADNRAGANGVLASETVARATPDGYTLLMTSGGHTSNPHIYRKLPYDTLADFTPITCFLTTGGLMVVATPSFAARTVPQLIDLARAAPGRIAYASAGVGNLTHLAGEMFNQMAGVKLLHVPYKGGGPAIIDVIGGQVPLMFASGPISIPHVKTGKLRALAYTGVKRFDQLPDVPTMDESGLKGYEAIGWYGLYGPARLPAPILTRIYEATRDGVRHPEARQAFAQFNIEPADSTPAQFARFLREDLVKYGKIVKAAGIEPQ